MKFGTYLLLIFPSVIKSQRTWRNFSGLGAVLMDGGAETSASYLQHFVISLLQSPESQRKAQKEIDSVVDGDRFPVLADFERLPYIKALVREVCLIPTNVRLLQYVYVSY
jgi:cytochrome P450